MDVVGSGLSVLVLSVVGFLDGVLWDLYNHISYLTFVERWRIGQGERHVLPTPTAGRTFTSIAASCGSSSRRCTSIGPFTAPMTVCPFAVYLAEPSALCNIESSAAGTVILNFCDCLIVLRLRRWMDGSMVCA